MTNSKEDKLKRNVQTDTLVNGLTIITEEIPYAASIAINVGVRCGSRHEPPGLEGIAHLIEHMLFKGTESIPDPSKISETIEINGGSLNAVTDYETTAYWCRTLAEKTQESIQLLLQLITEPLLRPADIELERQVIIEEINSVSDYPNSRAEVMLDELMWPGTSLGRDIAGTIESVSKISHESLVEFMQNKYSSNNLVISVAGKLNHDEIIDFVQPLAESLSGGEANTFNNVNYVKNKSRFMGEERRVEQSHISIGFPGTSRCHELRHALDLLVAMLGEGMSSRLFQEIREKRGLAYDIGAGTSHHTDTGTIDIYAAVDKKKYEKTIYLISKELQKIKTDTYIEELDKVKSLFTGRLKLNMEDTRSVANWNCNQMLNENRFQSTKDYLKDLASVSLEDIRNVASEYLLEENMNIAVVGPAESCHDLWGIK